MHQIKFAENAFYSDCTSCLYSFIDFNRKNISKFLKSLKEIFNPPKDLHMNESFNIERNAERKRWQKTKYKTRCLTMRFKWNTICQCLQRFEKRQTRFIEWTIYNKRKLLKQTSKTRFSSSSEKI
jgi:hypothetical protein